MKPLDAIYYLIIFSVIIIFAVDIIATKVLLLWFHPPPASAWRQEQDGRVTIRVMELFRLEKAFKIFYSNCIEMG